MSVIHPGSSIVFDTSNLQHDDDEDEILQEEMRQQQELRELLSAELSDDLLEDEHSSANDSRQSYAHDASNEQGHQEPVDNSSNQQWPQSNHVVTVSSSEELHNAYYGNGYGYESQYSHNQNYGTNQQHYYDPNYGSMPVQSQQWHQQHGQQGFGNDGNIYQMNTDIVNPFQPYPRDNGDSARVTHPQGQRDEFLYSDQRQVEGREDYGNMTDGNRAAQRFDQQNGSGTVTATSSSVMSPQSSKVSFRQSYPPQNGQIGVADKWMKTNMNGYHDMQNPSLDSSPAKGNVPNLHDEINQACGDPRLDTGGRQMAQLQILYKARGKRIDELTKELEGVKSESARQGRMLNHQLAMTKDEKVGMSSSLEKSQSLVCEKDREIHDLKGRLEADAAEIDALKSAKNELVTKLQVSERTIESLHEQVTQLSSVDTMERARQQHDAVLSAATQRHESQVLELTMQLDQLRQQLGETDEELGKVQNELSRVSREAEQTLLDKTETINRLTKSLEEAQNQCQGLLAGSNENALAKHQVSDLLGERKRNEEEIAFLTAQVSDFEQHLKLYENALQLGAGARHARTGSMTDSICDLIGVNDIVKKLDWKTPPPQRTKEMTASSGEDELVDGLRQELHRALKCNKAKRDEIAKLKAQCSQLEEESCHWRSRVDEVQSQLKINASMPTYNAANADDEDKSARIRELEDNLKDANDEIAKIQESCTEVKQRMADMIHEHDVDKQRSVERCERALTQLHEDAKRVLSDEIVSEYEQKMYEHAVEHDAKLQEISSEMERLQGELHDVKQSYVHVCAEKDSIQQELSEEFEKEKEAIATEHQQAVDRLEKMLDDLEKEMTAKIKEERERHETTKSTDQLREEWEREKESEFTQRVETQVALAKVRWFEDFNQSKQDAIRQALSTEEEKWQQSVTDLEKEWHARKDAEMEERLNDLREKLEQDRDEEIRRLHEELESDRETALKTAQCMAELNKNMHKEDYEQEIQSKMEEAKAVWQKESDAALELEREKWEAEHACRVNDAVEEVRSRSQKQLETELEKQNSIMQNAVVEMKKLCDREKLNALKQKSSEMEREMKRLQDQHKADYERFVEEHRKTLNSFLEREKARSKPDAISEDRSTQVEGCDKDDAWSAEKRDLEIRHRNEITEIRRENELRCESLRKEIEDLTSKQHAINMKLRKAETENEIAAETATLEHVREASRLKIENERLKAECESAANRITELKERYKEDNEKTKARIRDEYKKWKKERSLLLDKLKQSIAKSESAEKVEASAAEDGAACRSCQESRDGKDRLLRTKDDAVGKAVSEMAGIYAETLTMIKDEMMSYIRETRSRTRETIARDRKHTAAKLKSHYVRARDKSKGDEEKKVPQSCPRVKVYENESDGSLEPTKDEDTRVRSQFRAPTGPSTTPKALRSWTDRTERLDPILDSYSSTNEHHQFPTKLSANHDKQMQPPRYAATRDSRLYSTTAAVTYSSRSPYLSSPSRRPLDLRDRPLISTRNNEHNVYCSPTRSRSVEYLTDRPRNGYRRGNSPYRGANP